MDPTAPLDIDASIQSVLNGAPLERMDLESVRLVLQGGSVIDWNRLHFQSLTDVDRYLRLHLLDYDDPMDRRRINVIYGEAVQYLEEHLGLHFSADLRDPEDVREVLIVASQLGGFRRRQIQACVILKMMHVINHMQAAELRFQTAMSEADLFDLADRRIMNAAEAMSATGIPLVAFYGNRKSRNSVITKLLAKRETIATTVFDKQRYRVVTERKDQILPAIGWMTRNLFPFNYIIPGQSHNNLLEGVGIPEETGLKRALAESTPSAVGPDPNPFSGASYRQVNFVVDFPVRVDHMVEPRNVALLGRTVFILVEFQVLDGETARSNEEGENAHVLYKERQRKKVGARLRKGGRSSGD